MDLGDDAVGDGLIGSGKGVDLAAGCCNINFSITLVGRGRLRWTVIYNFFKNVFDKRGLDKFSSCTRYMI